MTDVRISKEEYAELLRYKKENLLRQIEEIDAILSNTANDKQSLVQTSHSSNEKTHTAPNPIPLKINPNTNVKINGATGWKFILDDILRTHPEQSVPFLVAEAFSRHKLDMDREAVRKTIWSTLTSNSKDDKKRYVCILRNGQKLWRMHPEFKE